MSTFLIEVPAWLTALVLLVLMCVAWRLGWRRGHNLQTKQQEAPASQFAEPSLALLGLLLAFTFSMALGKHDQRRQMVVTDSNAIGDFYTCASLVKEPIRGKLQRVIREYTEHRLALAITQPSQEDVLKKLADIPDRHNQMQTLVGEAIDSGTPVAIPLVNTLNGVTSSHAARLAASRDRLPPSVVLLLLLAVLVSMVLMGMRQGAAGDWHLGATLGFIIVIGMTVWVTLDLNQPQKGLITVSQEPFQLLLSGMGK